MANHGICWIAWQSPGRLGIMARPRAGDWLEDEIGGWQRDWLIGFAQNLRSL